MDVHMLLFFQFDPIDREGIEAPASSLNKDNQYVCKKHGSQGREWMNPFTFLTFADVSAWEIACSQCYGWKKQITRARAAAKKAGKKSTS